MPRNPSGVYTLPNAPVVSGTPILSSDENTTREDIESEITNSLDRNGRGPMLAPIRVPSGSVAVPPFSFTDESNSGWYRAGAQDFRFSINAQDIFSVTSTGLALASGKVFEDVATLDADGLIPITQTRVNLFAQCRLKVVSGSQVRLFPYGGNALSISGTPRNIPAVGVNLANTDLPANDTTYYVYAYWTGSTIALEVSTTVYDVGDEPIAIKTGDATRTLVGMVRKTAGNFASIPTLQFVRSFYNDPGICGVAASNAATIISSAPFVELDSTIRGFLLLWQGEKLMGNCSFGSIGGAGPSQGIVYSTVGYDGAANINAIQGIAFTRAVEYSCPVAHFAIPVVAEGYHTLNVFGGVTSLTMQIQSGYTGYSYHTSRHIDI